MRVSRPTDLRRKFHLLTDNASETEGEHQEEIASALTTAIKDEKSQPNLCRQAMVTKLRDAKQGTMCLFPAYLLSEYANKNKR